jgi:hypothetical protein
MNKMEGPTYKKTKEPNKRTKHKGNIKFSNPPPVTRSISNRERGERPPERVPSLEEPSPTTTNMSQNRDVVMSLTLFVYKMCAKLKKKSLQHTSLFMP